MVFIHWPDDGDDPGSIFDKTLLVHLNSAAGHVGYLMHSSTIPTCHINQIQVQWRLWYTTAQYLKIYSLILEVVLYQKNFANPP